MSLLEDLRSERQICFPGCVCFSKCILRWWQWPQVVWMQLRKCRGVLMQKGRQWCALGKVKFSAKPKTLYELWSFCDIRQGLHLQNLQFANIFFLCFLDIKLHPTPKIVSASPQMYQTATDFPYCTLSSQVKLLAEKKVIDLKSGTILYSENTSLVFPWQAKVEI